MTCIRVIAFALLCCLCVFTTTWAQEQPSWERLVNSEKEPNNWLNYGGNLASHRFSSLDQINKANVKQLQTAWIFQTGELRGGLNATPLVVDGVMYLMGPMNRVFALDATNGRILWKYFYKLSTQSIPYQRGSRGVAVAYGNVYFGTLDNHFVALDAKTGRELWDIEIQDTKQCGCNVTSPPVVVKDKVIVGGTGGEHAHRGYLNAFDAKTGKHLWRFYTIPGPGEPGFETWGEKMWKYGGGPAWLVGSYDAELNLLYWGIGNPSSDFYDEFRPGANLYTNCIIALNPDTGKLQWYYQEVPHDMYDFDSAYECVLIDHEANGKKQKLLVHPNKGGYTWVVDRVTGKYLNAYPHVDNITWMQGVDKDGKPLKMQPVPPNEKTYVCPSAAGGRNWEASSYSPRTKLWYNMGWEVCNIIAPQKQEIIEGQPLFGGSMEFIAPKNAPATGHITAYDPLTGKRAWRFMTRYMNVCALLSTGSDLLFSGDVLGEAFALDAKTGEKLWAFNTGASLTGSPITYAVNGKQYVAMPTGMGSLVGGLTEIVWPEMAGKLPEAASTLVVFALPDRAAAQSVGKAAPKATTKATASAKKGKK